MASPLELSGNPQILTLPATLTVQSASNAVRNRHLSIEASWTGTPTGVFSLVCSFDGGTTFRTVPGASAEFTANGNAQPAGGASAAVWNFLNVPGGLWAILYTATSGTGSARLNWAWTD
jgi:hypothetical protein